VYESERRFWGFWVGAIVIIALLLIATFIVLFNLGGIEMALQTAIPQNKGQSMP